MIAAKLGMDGPICSDPFPIYPPFNNPAVMTYTFDILGVAPLLTVFEYQQQSAQSRDRSRAYLSSPQCTLDGLIQAADLLPTKPDWNWDEVVTHMINFWLKNEARVRYWQEQLTVVGQDKVIVVRVANVDVLRGEFERLFKP